MTDPQVIVVVLNSITAMLGIPFYQDSSIRNSIVTSGGKYSYAGLRTPRKAQFTLVLDDPTLAELQTAVETCAPASLVINYTPCGGSETAFFTKNAWITDYSTTASVDGVFEADITFLYDETPT